MKIFFLYVKNALVWTNWIHEPDGLENFQKMLSPPPLVVTIKRRQAVHQMSPKKNVFLPPTSGLLWYHHSFQIIITLLPIIITAWSKVTVIKQLIDDFSVYQLQTNFYVCQLLNWYTCSVRGGAQMKLFYPVETSLLLQEFWNDWFKSRRDYFPFSLRYGKKLDLMAAKQKKRMLRHLDALNSEGDTFHRTSDKRAIRFQQHRIVTEKRELSKNLIIVK